MTPGLAPTTPTRAERRRAKGGARGAVALVFAVLAFAVSGRAHADAGFEPTVASDLPEDVEGSEGPSPRRAADEGRPAKELDPFRTKPGYVQLLTSVLVGTGLRFNNPYRLATPLGGDAESVSRTATYVDVGLGMTFGNPLGLQHGFSLRTTGALEGVGQVVMTPSYVAWRRWRSLAAHGRAGVAAVLTPDVTWGFELAAGVTWFFLGGFGLSAEIVGDVFYGAGTRDVAAATYPVLSGQLGLVVAYEVLP